MEGLILRSLKIVSLAVMHQYYLGIFALCNFAFVALAVVRLGRSTIPFKFDANRPVPRYMISNLISSRSKSLLLPSSPPSSELKPCFLRTLMSHSKVARGGRLDLDGKPNGYFVVAQTMVSKDVNPRKIVVFQKEKSTCSNTPGPSGGLVETLLRGTRNTFVTMHMGHVYWLWNG